MKALQAELTRLRQLAAEHERTVQRLELSREEVRAQARSLELINAVADSIYRALNLSEVVNRALDVIVAYTRSVSVGIFSLRQQRDWLDLIGARGFSDAVLQRARCLPVDGSLTGIAVTTRQVVTTADLAADHRLEPATRTALAADGFALTVSVPLLYYDDPVGAMNLIYREQSALSERERDTLLAVGKTIGLAMANARYVEQIQAEISERKKAQVELTKFKFIVDHAGEEIYLFRPDGAVSYANAAAARSLATTEQQLAASRVSDFDPAFNDQAFRKHFEALQKADIPSFETVHQAFDGTLKTKELKAVYLRMDGEEFVCTIGHDITQRKAFEAERQRFENHVRKSQAVESLGAVAGGIAHDFNNLLAGILGNLSLASTMVEPASRLAPVLRESTKAAERARGLTRQLLTFARGGAPIKRSTDLHDVVKDAAEFAASGKSCRPDFDLPADLWPADIDADQIAQVVQNLVVNAIQATLGAGVVRISARNRLLRAGELPIPVGRYVELRISDSGTGIDPDLLDKIFEPYFTTKKDGTGLGLAVTWSIVDRHGGHISVSSRVGQGTTFRVLLPCASSEPVVAAADAAPPNPGTGRILVMDDEQLLRDVAKALLSSLGYDVSVAADGDDALTQYAAARNAGRPFDLVVLDLTIRGGTGGLETIRRLKEIDPGVRAIVSSGYSDDPVVAEYRQHGFMGVLEKPYQITQLGDAVRRALGDQVTRA